jgi:general secretion pathway protein G
MTMRGGYTLLEILLVLVLIGMVAALAVPRLLGGAARARRARATSDLQTLAQALERYRLDAGTYPPTLDALAAAPVAVAGSAAWRAGGYLERVPRDPWGAAYVYTTQENRYVLRSLGADHAPGGDGEDADLDAHAP